MSRSRRECGCDWRTVKKYLAEDATLGAAAGAAAGWGRSRG